MAKCIFDNLTPDQAKTLAEWFEGQGEQECFEWFDINGVPAPMSGETEIVRVGHTMDLDDGDVIVQCKTD
jgi:hypothetical protein